jgi:hypothetical protein
MAASNLPAPTGLGVDDFTKALRAAGLLETPSSGGQNRMKVDGTTFLAGDDLYVYNPKTKAPAFLAQIVDSPVEYQAMWFPEDGRLANAVQRPDIAGKMCKSYFADPTQAREHAEDGTSCRSCPVSPFVKRDKVPEESINKQKCSWRGDIDFRILDDDGKLKDETVWSLSLPTTSMMEFKGSYNDAEKGHVGDYNFVQLLVRLGASLTPENPTAGLMQAMTALRLGGVIAEVRSIPVQNPNNGNRYNVTQFIPIQILDVTEPAPEISDGVDNNNHNEDDLPF